MQVMKFWLLDSNIPLYVQYGTVHTWPNPKCFFVRQTVHYLDAEAIISDYILHFVEKKEPFKFLSKTVCSSVPDPNTV